MTALSEQIRRIQAKAEANVAAGLPAIPKHAVLGVVVEPRNKIPQRERPVRQPGHRRSARHGAVEITGHPGRGIEMSVGKED